MGRFLPSCQIVFAFISCSSINLSDAELLLYPQFVHVKFDSITLVLPIPAPECPLINGDLHLGNATKETCARQSRASILKVLVTSASSSRHGSGSLEFANCRAAKHSF